MALLGARHSRAWLGGAFAAALCIGATLVAFALLSDGCAPSSGTNPVRLSADSGGNVMDGAPSAPTLSSPPGSFGSATLTGENALAADAVLALPYPDLPTGQSDVGAVSISIAKIAVAVPQSCDAALSPPPEGGSNAPPIAEVSIVLATNDLSDGGPRVAAGTYPVVSGPADADGGLNAVVTWTAGSGVFKTSAGGNVTVNQFAATTLAGQFSTTLVALDGGRAPLQGMFTAEYCGP
jgi:hypothetical protein